MTNLAKSTEVAWRSILSFTKIESDFRLIAPLNNPASIGLYLTVMFDCYLAGIFNSLGSIVMREPWAWVNSIEPAAFPLFWMAITSWFLANF